MTGTKPVHPLDVPVTAVMKCISKWGAGSEKLVAAHDASHSDVSQIVNQTKLKAP